MNDKLISLQIWNSLTIQVKPIVKQENTLLILLQIITYNLKEGRDGLRINVMTIVDNDPENVIA